MPESEECCFLCDHPAFVLGRGIAYYRFYDTFKPGWDSLPICTLCLTKLRGPDPEEDDAR